MQNEKLTAQQELYDQGYELAHAANEAHTKFQNAITNKEWLEGVQLRLDTMPGRGDVSTAGQIQADTAADARQRFNVLSNAAGELLKPEVQGPPKSQV
jgi:hypothetical protein